MQRPIWIYRITYGQDFSLYMYTYIHTCCSEEKLQGCPQIYAQLRLAASNALCVHIIYCMDDVCHTTHACLSSHSMETLH